jgi:16S rRNA (guanine966-N2)-methyltransferase
MGKVREACFSTFTYFELYKPPTSAASSALCRHLDIFAGSGSVGLESLSRGATHCTFVDLAPQCCETITKNLELCRIEDKGQVVCADALEMLKNPVAAMNQAGIPCNEPPLPFQIVTICPPYEEVVYGELIDAVCNSKLVTDDTVVLIEYPIELGCLPHVYDLQSGGKMIGLRNRRYGRTVVAIYIINPTGKLDLAESRPEEFVSL